MYLVEMVILKPELITLVQIIVHLIIHYQHQIIAQIHQNYKLIKLFQIQFKIKIQLQRII